MDNFIIILLILIGVCMLLYFPFSSINKSKNDYSKYKLLYDNLTEDQKRFIGIDSWLISIRKGYAYYSLMGIGYRGLNISCVGRFNGYGISQEDNKYDKYAIAIYDDTGTQLGFIPKGNKKLHDYIIKEGGKVHAYGWITWDNGYFNGGVSIEYDKNLVTKGYRNKPCYDSKNEKRS